MNAEQLFIAYFRAGATQCQIIEEHVTFIDRMIGYLVPTAPDRPQDQETEAETDEQAIERIIKDTMPQPAKKEATEPAPKSNIKPDQLTDKQREVLEIFIDLHCAGKSPTGSQVAERMGYPQYSYIGSMCRSLVKKGFLKKSGTKTNNIKWTPLKNPDGTPFEMTAPKVTQCPPRYAAGYSELKIGV